MVGFRLIALKTGNPPRRDFYTRKTRIKLDPFKVLKPNTVYSFNSHFTFSNNDFQDIDYNPKDDLILFINNENSKLFPINICAIVGANGSGKSTLIELLYWANYNIGCSIRLLRHEESGKLYTPHNFLDLEILYSTKSKYYKMSFYDGIVSCSELELINNKLISKGIQNTIRDISDLAKFFYTIVINYSHYALNAYEIGDWIIPLFHKNDGYQTPIVLNPMRDNGNIDINKEKRLLVRRLQANILEDIGNNKPKDSLRNIVNNKIAKKLKLIYNPYHYQYASLEEQKNPELRKSVLEALEKHFDLKVHQEQLDESMFINVTVNYIIEKLIKISKTYRPYRRYRNKNENLDSIKYIDAYIKNIKSSNSHIVFKVKGAILYLKYYQMIFNNVTVNLNKSHILDVEELSRTIRDINDKEQFWVNTYMMAPPSFFTVEIILDDGSPFDLLSSGEKQRIHSISSISYHLINLNSVGKLGEDINSRDNYLSYRNINIVLDEIELYYHPEWQRRYIYDLLQNIGRINPKHIDRIDGINITVLTHSPYILSDIQNYNVIKLVEGEVMKNEVEDLTFGANIHELLTHCFFMDSTIGEFANEKIQDIIDFYYKVKQSQEGDIKRLKEEYSKNKKEYEFILNSIGEEVISGILANHIDFIREVLEEKVETMNFDNHL